MVLQFHRMKKTEAATSRAPSSRVLSAWLLVARVFCWAFAVGVFIVCFPPAMVFVGPLMLAKRALLFATRRSKPIGGVVPGQPEPERIDLPGEVRLKKNEECTPFSPRVRDLGNA